MARPQTTRLRESAPTPTGAKVIDAQFEVIGRRKIWDRVLVALAAIFWAALIGFAIPQALIISERLGAYFSGG